MAPFSSFRGLASFSFTGSGVVVEPIEAVFGGFCYRLVLVRMGGWVDGFEPVGGWMFQNHLKPDRFEEFHGLKLCDFFCSSPFGR